MNWSPENLSPSPTSPSKQGELAGNIQMERDVVEFNQKFGVFAYRIGSAIGHDPDKVRALIAHESRFQVNAKNEAGSKGLMQLTSSPIDDLGARSALYAPFFRKINLGDLPPNAPKELKELVQAFNQEPLDIAVIRSLLPAIKRLKSEPIVNLTIGNIFLASLEGRNSPRVESRKLRIPTTLATILEKPKLTEQVFKRVRHILPGVSPEEVVATIEQIQWDPSKFGEFLAIRDYNGNNQAYGDKIRHSDIYACVVMGVNLLSQKNPKYWLRIRGNH
jgi:hypothetical protein